MRDATSRLFVGGILLGLVGLVGCKDDPSFRMRWTLDGEDLSKAVQCSEEGVLTIAAITYDVTGQPVDLRRFPCFPQGFSDPDASVGGPALEPGAYAVQLLGTNRAFAVWTDEATLTQERVSAQLLGEDYDTDPKYVTCKALSDSPSCRPEELVCGCKHVDVVEGETVDLGDFDLGAPPECADGIDNDRDGLVDGTDPACGDLFSLDTREGRSVVATEIDLRLSFLDHNPSVGCRELGISRIEVRLGDEVLAETRSCDLSLRFSALFDTADGDAPPMDGLFPITLTVHALGDDGEPVAEPQPLPLQIPETLGGFFVVQTDFPIEAFLEPIVGPASFTVGYAGYPGAQPRFCSPQPTGSRLEIATTRITILDSHGRPLDPPVELADGTPLDGSDLPCPGQPVRTASLEWGDYLIAIEALSPEGEVCFSNLDEPARAAPVETFGVVAPRVSSSGSCRDCETDAECNGLACVDGMCTP